VLLRHQRDTRRWSQRLGPELSGHLRRRRLGLAPPRRQQRLLQPRRYLRWSHRLVRGLRRPPLHGRRDQHRLHARQRLQPRRRPHVDQRWRISGPGSGPGSGSGPSSSSSSTSSSGPVRRSGLPPHRLRLDRERLLRRAAALRPERGGARGLVLLRHQRDTRRWSQRLGPELSGHLRRRRLGLAPPRRQQRLLQPRRYLRWSHRLVRGLRRPPLHGRRDQHRLHARQRLQPRRRPHLDQR